LPTPSKATSAAEQAATVVIAAPADVSVSFNGVALNLKSTEQSFVTPGLEPGARYSYLVEARTVRDGQTITRSRKVQVSAGQEVRVDFSELAAAATASVATR
jgi:uncharacterized protein (TIGR03000 family)